MKKRIIIAIALIAVILLLFFIFRSCSTQTENSDPLELDPSAVDFTDNKTVATAHSIEIPGYESMTMQAEKQAQSVLFRNPQNNSCYFVVSLFLPDGTLIYKSGLIEPGKAIYDISLLQTVSAGTYSDCILQYSCYRMDDTRKQLNGARTHLTLIFK